mgnify:CR=1 FL=1
MFSWLIGFILDSLPLWFWPVIAGTGLVMYFFAGVLSHIPFLSTYSKFIKPVGFVVFAGGLFMYGGAGVTEIYQARVKEMQNKIAVAEEQSRTANAQLAAKNAQKNKVIHDVQVVYKDRIKEITTKIDAECKLDPSVSKLLNDAATNPLTNNGGKK